MKTSVIFPARSEEKLIKHTLEDVYKHLKNKKYPFEILVVVNGSVDKTNDIVEAMSKKFRQIKILKSKVGYGAALRKGLKDAKGDYIVIYNVDFYDKGLIDFVDVDLLGKDIVVGSKSTYWSSDKRPINRVFVTKTFNLFLKIIYGFRGSDTHGIKVIRSGVRDKILPLCKTKSGIFDTEFLIRAQYANYKFMEYPVEVSEKRKPRFSNRIFETPIDLIKLYKTLKMNN